VDQTGQASGSAALGYHLNLPFGADQRNNFSAFGTLLGSTFTQQPPNSSGPNWTPQLTLDYEHLFGGADAKHSQVNTGVNVSAGTQASAPISALFTSTGPTTSPNAAPTSAFAKWPINLGAVANVTANLLYRGGETPHLTPWIEVYAGTTAPGMTTSAWTAGGSLGATWNQPLGGPSPVLSVGVFGGGRVQSADVAGNWTNQASWYAGGGVGLSF